MSILALKQALFPPIGSSLVSSQTLDAPLLFLQNKFHHRPTDHAKMEYNSVYFYSGARLTQYDIEGTVKKSNINVFSGPEHAFELECTPEVFQGVMQLLREAMLLAYNSGQFPLSSRVVDTFDQFWAACQKPKNNRFHVDEYAWDKRKRMKRYINLYQFDNGAELTGRQSLPTHSKVVANVRFSAAETECDDGLIVGIRTFMGAGIRIKELGGQVPVIESPWDWSNVNADTLTTPMYPTIRVKTPALRVVDFEEGNAKVDMEAKPLYTRAIHDLHERAGASPWDGSIEMRGALKAHIGGIIVGVVSPTQNKNAILWHTEHYHASARRQAKRSAPTPTRHRHPPQQKKQKAAAAAAAGEKTNRGNTDNSAGE